VRLNTKCWCVQFPGVFLTRSKQSSIDDRLARFTSFTEQTNPVLRDLMVLLEKEAEAGGPSGKVYAESLSTALATRLLFAARSLRQPRDNTSSPLPRRVLRRVFDRMEAEFDSDLTLTQLAAESGYSRTHFLRMFRGATGQSPHRYLLELRLKKAASMLASRSLSLMDIALACGFSSHAHFSTAFRSRFGLSPSAFRRKG